MYVLVLHTGRKAAVQSIQWRIQNFWKRGGGKIEILLLKLRILVYSE